MTTERSRLQHARSIAIVSSGNFLEMYDFMVFGYYAPAISKAFFPVGTEFGSLMLALMTFGAGFLMRPVGAIVLGAYIDKHGRRKGLLLTLGLMAVGTLTIAAMPTYAAIGIAAPLMIVAGRLVQGLSAGVELGGVSVYLSEIAPKGRRGFFVAWQSASQQIAVVSAAGIGLAAGAWLSPAQMDAFGWRIPFAVGCVLIPMLLLVRRLLEETPDFLARTERATLKKIVAQVGANWSLVLRGAGLAVMTTVFFYMITAYTPTFGSKVLRLSAASSLLVTLCVGVANFVLLPVMGALSDRIGRRPQLIAAALVALVSGYPAMHWLAADPSFARLLTVELGFAAIFATYNGAMVAFLTEVMPPAIRTSAFSLAYSLATALFGGFTPAIATGLIRATGDRAIPGAWLSAAAVLALAATLSFGERRGRKPPHL
ncbi:MAG: tricarballylate/proton symporter TcuC [Caulobacteraceae bacterium]